ncbi:MAG: ATP-binding cassette domain-containing protein [Verrucomicrobiota bacterium JB023]|nr:ATP-binding cassette domain-containing protein [Verrucomicrobiota bacterium JB023]
MLQLDEISFHINQDGGTKALLDKVTLQIPAGHFMAIVGPSGCGKTTLLKTIAGINPESEGAIYYDGRNLAEEGDLEPHEIGYVPQFSIAYDELTVDESIEAAARLRVRTKNAQELDTLLDRVLHETGLTEIADRPVSVLSGGQKRRLGLAMELVSSPKLLLADEVTSGLDPRSEREIVHLLHDLSRQEGRTVISVTHSLAHLELYDSLLVLHEGRVAYHGPPSGVTHYFSVDDTEEVYPTLAQRDSEGWKSSWDKHRARYQAKLDEKRAGLIEKGELQLPPDEVEEEDETRPIRKSPGFFAQFATLLGRRWRIFSRDRAQIILQFALIVGFPILVALFSPRANEQGKRLSSSLSENAIEEMTQRAEVRESQLKVGSANSGIIMFQVVLLCLMGSNNAAREVAAERRIVEKEKFGGLSPAAYLAAKAAYLAVLVLVQSLWMGFFVEYFWKFRGDFTTHLGFLVLVNAAMTSICLGISAQAKSAEQASLLSIYLVGFQLPLSGAVLALPAAVEPLTRPFISAYWAWSGSISALSTETYSAIKGVTETTLSPERVCLFLLASHLLIGLVVAFLGLNRPKWEH